jgi:hypothetical protein
MSVGLKIFAVQDSISERVVRALTLELKAKERERLTKRDTESLEAYEAQWFCQLKVEPMQMQMVSVASGGFRRC